MSTATTASTFQEALAFFESAFPPIALEALSRVGQGISVITPDYRIVWASPAMESWAGPLEAIRGRPCYQVYQRREDVCPDCPSAKAFATGERASCPQPGFAHDGRPLWFELTAAPVKDASGATPLVMEVATDITQTLAAQERERLLTSLLDHSREMVAFIDTEGLITDVNPAALASVGCGREELIGQPATALLGYALPEEEARQMLEASLTTGWRGEAPVVSRRGRTTWIDLSCCPVKDREGRVVGVIGIATDITQRRQAELALRSSEQRYRQLFERLNDAVLIADPLTGRLLDVNAAAERLTGRSRDELVGMPQNRLHPPDQAEAFGERLRRRLAQATVSDLEGEIVGKDGAVVPVQISVSVTEICGVAVIQAIYRDITDRSRSEEALRASEERYRCLFERLNDAVFVADPETGVLLDVNAAAERLTGRSRHELAGMHQSKLHPADQVEAYRERFRRHVAQGTAADFDAEVLRKDGTVVPVSISAALAEVSGQRVIQGIFHDMSERQQAEQALRRSELLNRNLVEHLPQRIFLKDRNSVYVSCNANYARDLGIEPECIGGKDDFDLHPRELADMYRADDQAVIASRTPKDIEEKYLASGEERWVHTIKLPYLDEQGNVVGLLGIFEDITERKKAEDRLRQAWEVTNTILESLPIGVMVVGRDKQIRQLNAAALRMMGRDSPHEVVGTLCHQHVCPAEDGKCPIVDLGQRVDNSERELIAHGGERIPILKSVLPIALDGEEVLLEAFVDIAEPKRMEAELRKHQQSLEASNARLAEMAQEMQQFLYLVSHDLRSPLVTIEGFASRLLKRHAEQWGDEAKHALERIRASVSSMARLIEGLLLLSRANTSELTPTPLDMNEVVAEVARDLEQQAADAGVRVAVECHLPSARGDPRAVYQVLLNLMSNAIKYHGEADPCVWIGGQVRDEGVEFTVRDNGLGIEADKLDSIFQMFTRADSSGRPGLGIGLTGAKRLVERHGGRIWAESAPGQGSIFHFTLPNQEVPDGQAPPTA